MLLNKSHLRCNSTHFHQVFHQGELDYEVSPRQDTMCSRTTELPMEKMSRVLTLADLVALQTA